MVEKIDDKIDRINGDISNIIDLYDYAEKLYPYTNLREANSVSNTPISHINS